MRRWIVLLLWGAVLALLWVAWTVAQPPAAIGPEGRRDGDPAAPAGAATAATGAATAGEVTAPAPAVERSVAPAGSAAGPAALLTGTVRSAGGAAVGAEVRAASSDVDGMAVFDRAARAQQQQTVVASTDAQGRFELRVAAGVPHRLEVRAAGWPLARRSGCVAGAHVDVVLQPAASIAVRVVRARDDLPVAGVAISASRRDAGLGDHVLLFSGQTGADGTFRLAGLEPGPATLVVRPADLVAPRWEDFELPPGGEWQRLIRLDDGATIRGRVFDARTERPLAGATVRDGPHERSVTTARDGTFVFAGYGEGWLLYASAPGYGEREVAVRARGQPAVAAEVEIGLLEAAAVRGRVVDDTGRELADVYVAVAASDYDGPQDQQRLDWRSAWTAADGAFAISGVRTDMAQSLLLRRPGFGVAIHDLGRLQPAEQLDLGALTLRRGGVIAGRLHDERDQPIAGQRVELQGHNGDRFARAPAPADGYRVLDTYVATRATTTGDDGAFVFTDVAAGDYVVRTSKFDSHEQEVRAVTLAAGARADVELALVRGVALAGRVVASDGGEVPTLYLSIDPEDGQSTAADVEAGRDGSFVARGLQPGNYRLSLYPYARPADRAAGRAFRPLVATHVPAGGGEARLELQVLLPVRARVLAAGGRPATDLRVVARDGAEVLGDGSTDAEGRVVLSGLAGRSVRLSLLRQGAEAGAADAPPLLAADVMPGGAEVVLHLPPR